MTVYVLTITEFHAEGENLVEVFSTQEKAVARLRGFYEEALNDPKCSEHNWYENQGIVGCSWFDPQASYNETSGDIVAREIQ